MFDPTIFDNWKVVAEGAMYDLDREGELEVIGRSDVMDLASLSRSFAIGVRRPGGSCRAELRLSAGLIDFAGERYELTLTESEPPGIRLEARFTLPGSRVRDAAALHASVEAEWARGEYADDAAGDIEICHRVRIELDPHAPPASAAEAGGSSYEIAILFHRKWNEDHIADLEALERKLLATLDALEAGEAAMDE
ncbi:hypothetical protein MO973_26565 [Paenibacillus sp. TRM 82003]|nr:hypothetical protein [Paenibacillus sp. TRM 82003]